MHTTSSAGGFDSIQDSLSFSDRKWSDFQNLISQRNSEVSASKSQSEWRGIVKIPAAIFLQKCGIAWMKWRQSHNRILKGKKWWTKPQGFSSRGDSRSSLKTEGFLQIFTKLQRRLTCEVAPWGRLWRRFAYALLVKLPPAAGVSVSFYSAPDGA